MKSNIDTVIQYALDEVGYIEKKSNAELDNKTANVGANNFTKYGKAQGCNGQPWCDAFIDYCFINALGKQEAQKLLCGFSNYTPTSAQYFKEKGLFVTSQPQRGDIIFFKNSTRICHTGLVIEVDRLRVSTVEGNTSKGGFDANGGGVFVKSYDLLNSRIAGYGRPNYDPTQVQILYKGCIGAPVRELQMLLNEKHPYNKIVVDGDFGTKTFNKLVESQALLGLEKTGICDYKTWKSIS